MSASVLGVGVESIPTKESEFPRAWKRGRARHLISDQPRPGTGSHSMSRNPQPKPSHPTSWKTVSGPPKHVQGSYQLTIVQAPGTPDDNSAKSSQCGKGVGGLEPVYFPAVMPIPAISSLPEGSAQRWWGWRLRSCL